MPSYDEQHFEPLYYASKLMLNRMLEHVYKWLVSYEKNTLFAQYFQRTKNKHFANEMWTRLQIIITTSILIALIRPGSKSVIIIFGSNFLFARLASSKRTLNKWIYEVVFLSGNNAYNTGTPISIKIVQCKKSIW